MNVFQTITGYFKFSKKKNVLGCSTNVNQTSKKFTYSRHNFIMFSHKILYDNVKINHYFHPYSIVFVLPKLESSFQNKFPKGT